MEVKHITVCNIKVKTIFDLNIYIAYDAYLLLKELNPETEVDIDIAYKNNKGKTIRAIVAINILDRFNNYITIYELGEDYIIWK